MNNTVKVFFVAILCVTMMVSFNACKTTESKDSNIYSNNKGIVNADTLVETVGSSDSSESNSAVTTHNMYCIIKEIKGNHYIVEKTKDNKMSGILYQFVYNSEQFSVGDEIVVEFKYPIADSVPYGLTDVKVYKSEKA